MSLDLGDVFGRVVLDAGPFNRTYTAVVAKMRDLGVRAERATTGTVMLDKGLAGVAESSTAASTGLGRTAKAAAEAGASVSRAAAAAAKQAAADAKAAEAATAQAAALERVQAITGKDVVAKLRAVAAQERLNTLMASGTATTARLAAAQASAIAATNKLADSDSRLARVQDAVMSGAGKLGAALKNGVAVGAVVAAGAIYESVKAAAAFQTATTRIHTQAGATVAATRAMAAGMLRMAASVGTLPTALAAAGFHISSANQNILSMAQELHVLRLAAEGAKLGGSDLVDTTNALDAAVVSGIQGVKNFNVAMGALNATVGSGDMTMQNLADALGTGVLAVIKGYGVTLRQAGAALATFGDNNIRGAMAGTQLRMAVQSLTVPSSKAAAALAKLGLTGKDAFTHFAADLQRGGLSRALADLHARLVASGVGIKGWGEILTQAFTKRAGAGINVLLQQFSRYQAKLREVGAASGRFAGDWKSYTKTFAFAKDQFKAAAQTLGVEIGDKLLPTATHVFRWMATTGAADVRRLGRELTPLGHFIAGTLWPAMLRLGQVLLGAVGSAFRDFSRTVRNNADGLKTIGAIAMAVFAYVLPNAIKTAAAVLGMITVAVGWVGKGFLDIYKAARAVVGFFTGPFLRAVGTVASVFLTAVKDMADVWFSVVGTIVNTASKAFGWLPFGIGGKLKSAAREFDSFRSSVDGTLAGAAADAAHWGEVAATNWNSAWNNAMGFGHGKSSPFRDPGHPGYGASSTAAKAAQAGGQKVGSAFGDGMVGGFNAATPAVSSAAGKLASAAVNAAKSAYDRAKSKLNADLGVRNQEGQSIASTLLQGMDLSQAVVNGRTGDLRAFMRLTLNPIKRLDVLERRLRDAGLSPKLLAMIANAGPQQGVALATNILSGQSGSIAQLNRLAAQADAYAGRTGRLVAHSLYDTRIARDRQDVHNSYLELKKLNRNVAELVKATKANDPRRGVAALDAYARTAHHKAHARTNH